jgi:hypothetical protein
LRERAPSCKLHSACQVAVEIEMRRMVLLVMLMASVAGA